MWRVLAVVLASAVVVACTADTFQGVDSGACPSLAGNYSVSVSGPLCPTAPDSTICLKQTGCQVVVGGNSINATVTIDSSGGFTNGSVKEGSANRSGCSGTWSSTKSVLTINCGGTGTSQSCDVVLTRESSMCN